MEDVMTKTITQIEKVLYTAKAHTIGGREGGTSRTSDGRLDVKLTPPGAKGDGTNPEQLFAAGWTSPLTPKSIWARPMARTSFRPG
jgi:organic hydroperoxide reductase OsmC/OhrA